MDLEEAMNTLKQRIRPSFLILFIGWIPNCGKTPSPSRLEGETMASVQTSPEEGSTPNRNRIPEPGPEASRQMLADLNCKYGEIPRWSEAQGGWACASGQDSLAQKTCSTVGEVLAWSGTAWECATDQDMLYTLNCQQGEVAIAGDYGDPWSCAKDSDQAIELSCPRGQILKWKSSKWECTPDEDQAAKLCGAGQKFARKTNSGWECKAEDDMQQMHLSLYRPAAPRSAPSTVGSKKVAMTTDGTLGLN